MRLGDQPILLADLCGLAQQAGMWRELADILAARRSTGSPEEQSAWGVEHALALHRKQMGMYQQFIY